MTTILFGRPGCHLCDEARDRLRELGVQFDEIDIEADDQLHAEFLERIPVVAISGRIVSELVFDEAAVRAAITSPR